MAMTCWAFAQILTEPKDLPYHRPMSLSRPLSAPLCTGSPVVPQGSPFASHNQGRLLPLSLDRALAHTVDSFSCNSGSSARRQAAASEGRIMSFFLTVLGLVMVLEGMPYFAFPERIKSWLAYISTLPAGRLRLVGFAAMAVGMGLVYLGQHG